MELEDKNYNKHHGILKDYFGSFDRSKKICELCKSNGRKIKTANSHSLQRAALIKLLDLNNVNDKDREVIDLQLFGNSVYGLLADSSKKPGQTVTEISKNIGSANVFHNLCDTCEKSHRYESFIHRHNNDSFSEEDLKQILLKGFISSKYYVDREIYVQKTVKRLMVKGEPDEKERLSHLFPNRFDNLRALNRDSQFLGGIIQRFNSGKRKVVKIIDLNIDNNSFVFKFGCLTSRTLQFEDERLLPITIYVSPYGDQTKILVLGDEKTNQTLNENRYPVPLHRGNEKQTLLFLIKILTLNDLMGMSFAPHNLNIGAVLSLSYEIKHMLISGVPIDEYNELQIKSMKLLALLKTKPIL